MEQTMLFIDEEAIGLPANLHPLIEAAQGGPLDLNADPELMISEAELYGVSEGFYPDTEDKIEWVVGKIAAARDAVKRIKQNSAERIKREEGQERYFLTAYSEAIRLWAKDHLPKRSSTVSLDNGKLSFVNAGRRIKISEDDEAAVALAEQIAPDLITIIPAQRKVNRLELAKRIQIVEKASTVPGCEGEIYHVVVNSGTGEVIESEACFITEPEERFSIKTA